MLDAPVPPVSREYGITEDTWSPDKFAITVKNTAQIPDGDDVVTVYAGGKAGEYDRGIVVVGVGRSTQARRLPRAARDHPDR